MPAWFSIQINIDFELLTHTMAADVGQLVQDGLYLSSSVCVAVLWGTISAAVLRRRSMKCAAFVQGLTPLRRTRASVRAQSRPRRGDADLGHWGRLRPSPYSIAQALDQIYAGYGDNGQAEDTLQVKMQMGLDHKYPDQQIRFQVELPNGSGSERRVAVFCPPEEEQEMLDLGAKLAGKTLQDALLEETFDFDVLITKPQSMPAIAKLGKVLGPKWGAPNMRKWWTGDDDWKERKERNRET
eukprot:g21664.t1